MSSELQPWTDEIPHGWAGGEAFRKWYRGEWRVLYKLQKVCVQCNGMMRMDVTRSALRGDVHNSGLRLTRCAACRAESKAVGGHSRPKVEGQHNPVMPPTDTEELRAANTSMRDELTALYAENRDLRQQLGLPVFKWPWEG